MLPATGGPLCHRNTGYLKETISAQPRGRLWERIAYLELLLKYIDVCRAANVSHDLVAAGLAGINERAANLVRVCRSDATRHRLMKLLADTASNERQ